MKNYISSEESTIVGEGEGEVNNVNNEHLRTEGGGPRIGGGGRGRGIGGGRGRGREGEGDRGEPNPVGFPIYDEDTTTTLKNISPSILPNFN